MAPLLQFKIIQLTIRIIPIMHGTPVTICSGITSALSRLRIRVDACVARDFETDKLVCVDVRITTSGFISRRWNI